MNLSPPSDLPAALAERFEQVAGRLAPLPSDVFDPTPEAAHTVARVAVCSDFVLTQLTRSPAELLARVMDPAPLDPRSLAARLDLRGLGEPEAMSKLRRVRHLEMARIAWRDFAGWSSLEASFADLSTLADACIRAALQGARSLLETKASPEAIDSLPPLLVLAMGKLGGEELNYSSDVDLVLLCPDSVVEDLDEADTHLRRVAQKMIRLLDHPTADGFAFRVDTRLRPFGASGPLVVGLSAFETYLVSHGRDWERYAYVKARLLTGEQHASEVFEEVLTPFVYRRYLDYGVFESLRQMKSLIAREVARRDLADNIKLGPGGIREIEFIVQAFQLVRGGRDPYLRARSLLEVLPRLAETRLLGERAVEELGAAYRFLRCLENRLQAFADQQLHELPSDPAARARLAYAMGEQSWEALLATLTRHRENVEAEFARVAWDAPAAAEALDGAAMIRAAWETGRIAEAVGELDLKDPDAVAGQLVALRTGPLYQRMDEPSRQRLSAVVARTVPLLEEQANPGTVLRRLLAVFEAVCRRSVYLALLNENPGALERLIALAGQSDFIVRQIARHPLLLDELLDARLFETPPTRDELKRMLEQQLDHAGSEVESRLEAMRLFQRAAVFRIAVADRLGHLPLMKVSDRLTDTAELVLEFALETAWSELVERVGPPMCGDPPHLREAGFAIIGYGKLGGLELGYGSDLDLVFLHDSQGKHQETAGATPLENARFYVRLAQRLIHFLTIQTSSGRLYEVDTRLRPSGGAGPMVASISSFSRYQRDEAWVWEHQALLRSRAVAGTPSVREAFENERREVLVHHVDRRRLKAEVSAMRRRMRQELSLGTEGTFDLKQDRGGLADIEFLIDYWVLAHAAELPELVEFPDNVRQLEALERTGLVAPAVCGRLKDCYLTLRQRTHELALGEGGRLVPAEEFAELRAWVIALWDEVFGEEASSTTV